LVSTPTPIADVEIGDHLRRRHITLAGRLALLLIPVFPDV
jgi:hypothetical protein